MKQLGNYKIDDDEIYFPINIYTLKTQSNCLTLLLHCSDISTEDLFTLYSYAILLNFNIYFKRQLFFFFYEKSVKLLSIHHLTVSFPDLLNL